MNEILLAVILYITNLDRHTPLKLNSSLTISAQHRAEDINDSGLFAHHTQSGKSIWSYITDEGYSYSEAGENLAKGFKDPWSMHKAFMASPKHKDNIQNERYTEMGIGMSGIYVVEYFARPFNQLTPHQ